MASKPPKKKADEDLTGSVIPYPQGSATVPTKLDASALAANVLMDFNDNDYAALLRTLRLSWAAMLNGDIDIDMSSESRQYAKDIFAIAAAIRADELAQGVVKREDVIAALDEAQSAFEDADKKKT